jgi:hypothetical protein
MSLRGTVPDCRHRDYHGFLRALREDVRVDGEMRPLTGGTQVPFLPVSGPLRGLETLLSPRRLPLPSALAAESLRPL